MWQPTNDLQSILEYLESSGLSREVIKARIFQIFMKDDSLSISLKAGEMLLSFSEDDDTSGNLPYSQLIVVQNLTKKILGAENDNLARVIADVSAQSHSESDTESIPDFIRRVSFDDVPAVPPSQTQSSHHASPNTGQAGQNQTSRDRNAAQTRENRDNLGTIPDMDIGTTT